MKKEKDLGFLEALLSGCLNRVGIVRTRGQWSRTSTTPCGGAIVVNSPLALGRSSTRVMPSVTSGRYSPGPSMAILLREHSVFSQNSSTKHAKDHQHNPVMLLQTRKTRDFATAVRKHLRTIHLHPLIESHGGRLTVPSVRTRLANERARSLSAFNPAARSALRQLPNRLLAARYKGPSSSSTAAAFILLFSRRRARIARRTSSSDQRVWGWRRR